MTKGKIVGALIGLSAILCVASPVEAGTLTPTQINTIVSLLRAFDADQSVITSVSAVLGGTSNASPSCVDLSGDLTLGASGPEVTSLQNYLIGNGYLAAQYETGYYGFLTAQAVGQLQVDRNILSSLNDPAYGITGPQTRGAVGCNNRLSMPVTSSNPQSTNSVEISYPTAGTTLPVDRKATVQWSIPASFVASIPQDVSASLFLYVTKEGDTLNKFSSAVGDGWNLSARSAVWDIPSEISNGQLVPGTYEITAKLSTTAEDQNCALYGIADSRCSISPAGRAAVAQAARMGTTTGWFFVGSTDGISEEATVDENSLVTVSRNPTITGTATGVPYVRVSVNPLQGRTIFESGAVSVVDGRWSTNILANLMPGKYLINVYDPDGAPSLTQNMLSILAMP